MSTDSESTTENVVDIVPTLTTKANDRIIQDAVTQVIETIRLSIRLKRPSPMAQLTERLLLAEQDYDKAASHG